MNFTDMDANTVSNLYGLPNTPIKVVSPNRINHPNETIQETTYNDVLLEAMKKLQLSSKSIKMDFKSQSTSTPLPIPSSFKTPKVPKQRISKSTSFRAMTGNQSSCLKDISNSTRQTMNALYTPTPSKYDEKMNKSEILKQEIKIKESCMETVKQDENATDVCDHKENANEIATQSQIKSSVESKSAISQVKERSKQQCKSVTYQCRRQSLCKFRRRSSQYVSLAEAVSKFPKRFRSVGSKQTNVGPVNKVKQASRITVAVSPLLISKSRVRPVNIPSKEEREKLEMEEMKKHQIKANPVKVNILEGAPPPLKEVPKKPVTVPEPFHLTETKKFKIPPQKQELLHNKEVTKKPSAPTIVITNEDVAVEKQEVLFFGIPSNSYARKNTHTVPFSFEMRNKEYQTKKEQKLKELMEKANQTKVEFHARPVPNFHKPVVPPKEQNIKKPIVPCPFSFEQRDKYLLEKKEKMIKEVLENDKKARLFHANPAPVVKPVIVQSVSKENLKMKEKNLFKEKQPVPLQGSRLRQENKYIRVKTITRTSKAAVNNEKAIKCNTDNVEQENKDPNTVSPTTTDNTNVEIANKQKKETLIKQIPVELNTDKRAKARREFDEKRRQKEMEEEARRQKDEEERLAKEKAEKAELRKLAEIKANPIPLYKPLVQIKSKKPLTNPQSPAWASKCKAN